MIRKIDSNIFSLTILKVTTFSRIRHISLLMNWLNRGKDTKKYSIYHLYWIKKYWFYSIRWIKWIKSVLSSSNRNSIYCTINMFLSLGEIFVQKCWMCVQRRWMYVQSFWTAVQRRWTEIFPNNNYFFL